MKNSIEQIDLEHYFALAKNIIPKIESLNVVDRSGNILWSNPPSDDQLVKAY